VHTSGNLETACAAAAGRTAEIPQIMSDKTNRRPSIRVGQKNISGERGLLKTAFPLNV